MKRRTKLIILTIVGLIGLTGGVMALQPSAPKQQPIALTASTNKPKPVVKPVQQTAVTSPSPAPAASAATVAAATPVAAAPAAPTEPASCTPTDLRIYDSARDNLAIWKAQNGDQAAPTNVVRVWTYQINEEMALGCQ